MSKEITSTEFVKAWMFAHRNNMTQTDLCEHLGVDRAMLSYRKRAYIKRGVKLPELKSVRGGNRKRLDVEALNKLVEER